MENKPGTRVNLEEERSSQENILHKHEPRIGFPPPPTSTRNYGTSLYVNPLKLAPPFAATYCCLKPRRTDAVEFGKKTSPITVRLVNSFKCPCLVC